MVQGATPETAADIVQDTMLQAYRKWDQIEHPLAWARKVASREYGRRIAAVDEVASTDGRPLFRLDSDTEMWEQRYDIMQLLAALPPRQRQVMAWKLEGCKPSEIAEVLGMEPAAVRASLMKARRQLAAHFTGPQEDPR